MPIRSLIFFLCFAGIQTTAYAQFKEGDKMVGASIASAFYNTGTADVSFPAFNGYSTKSSGYGLRIEPTLGWFISDKTVLGVSVNINPSGEKLRYSEGGTTFQEDKSSTFNIGIGGFGRNYFSDAKTWMPFGQFGFNVGISSLNSEGFGFYSGTPDYKETYDGSSSGGFFANASLQLGMTKMVSQNTGLDVFFGYSYSYNTNTMKTVTSTDIDIDGDIDFTSTNEPTTKFTNHGFIVGVGFQVFLRGKKK